MTTTKEAELEKEFKKKECNILSNNIDLNDWSIDLINGKHIIKLPKETLIFKKGYFTEDVEDFIKEVRTQALAEEIEFLEEIEDYCAMKQRQAEERQKDNQNGKYAVKLIEQGKEIGKLEATNNFKKFAEELKGQSLNCKGFENPINHKHFIEGNELWCLIDTLKLKYDKMQ